jgi:2-hydroxy-3-keto-5-methylthiopentenyl-1-phosphate phosphatase
MPYSLFIDFDGTITTVDVGSRVFTRFSGGKNADVVERWIRREVTSIECLTEEARLMNAERREVVEFVRQFAVDPGFHRLMDLCRENRIDITVVSDGLDVYIREILNREGYTGMKVMSNISRFSGDTLQVEFPHRHESCGFCGNCKGAAIRNHLRPGHKSIFVGDGYSDLCAIDAADYLFAKADLASYLARSGKSFLPFGSLHEVADRISDEILSN